MGLCGWYPSQTEERNAEVGYCEGMASRMRMALASACKERDELKKQLNEAKSELAAMRNELCCKCGNYREAHNGACNGCRWKEA